MARLSKCVLRQRSSLGGLRFVRWLQRLSLHEWRRHLHGEAVPRGAGTRAALGRTFRLVVTERYRCALIRTAGACSSVRAAAGRRQCDLEGPGLSQGAVIARLRARLLRARRVATAGSAACPGRADRKRSPKAVALRSWKSAGIVDLTLGRQQNSGGQKPLLAEHSRPDVDRGRCDHAIRVRALSVAGRQRGDGPINGYHQRR